MLPTINPKVAKWWQNLHPTHQRQVLAEITNKARADSQLWPVKSSRTLQYYSPHEKILPFLEDITHKNTLLRGGWGSGKSVAGVVKVLGKLNQGLNGIMVSPELEHFKTSLWPVFREWCPWDKVVKSQQRRRNDEWEPTKTFSMVFTNGAILYCGGIKDATRWFGGNVNFCHFDEGSRYPDASALKTLIGRARVLGPLGEMPQVFLTTTPAKNWLYDYFGDIRDNDPFATFKTLARVYTVKTSDNIHLSPGYESSQRDALTASEARQYLEAEWEDISDIEKFVNLIWWDSNREELPGLTRSEPMVLALDAATGGESSTLADCFAIVGVTRHPHRKQDIAVRYCGIYQPQQGQLLDYEPIEQEVRRLCKEFSVIEVTFDPTQLHDMTQRMQREGIALFKRFNQGQERLVADKDLQNLIASRRVSHDGNPLLRTHIDNAYVKKYGTDGVRIVKRTASLKVDGTVALSMGTNRCLYYNLM